MTSPAKRISRRRSGAIWNWNEPELFGSVRSSRFLVSAYLRSCALLLVLEKAVTDDE